MAIDMTHEPAKVDRDERVRRAYRLAMIGGVYIPHTEVTPFYESGEIWREDGTPSRHVLLTAELNRRGLNH
jgi:hypothetical protein